MLSITKTAEKRKRIIDTITNEEKILIVGCGSVTYLQEDLLQSRNVEIVAADFSQKMLAVSQRRFQHPNLECRQADTRSLPKEFKGQFDTVVSTNSIIPPMREDVVAMYTSIYQSLQDGGQMVAYLPSYTMVKELLERHPELREVYGDSLDDEQCRFVDTVGWQCFHTEELILNELHQAGFNREDISIERVPSESAAEAEGLTKIYGTETVLNEYWCFFVRVKKRVS